MLAFSRKTMERELGGSMTRVEWRELCLHIQQEMAEWVADESHFLAMGFFKKRAEQSGEDTSPTKQRSCTPLFHTLDTLVADFVS